MAQPHQLFANNAVSLLSAGVSATDTSLQVIAGHGDMFPNPGANEFFLITLEDQAATVREIIRVTGRTGDVLTFDLADRGQEGTQVRSWASTPGNDTLVDLRITAATMELAMALPVPGSIPASNQEVVDGEFTIETRPNQTDLLLPYDYQPNTTKLFIGGLRLKRNVDFFENGPSKVTLNFSLTQANIDDGSAIVVDYIVA